MAAKKESKAPADKVALYEKLVATNPNVERKGATMPYTSVNGHMFSLMIPNGTLALRLSAEDKEAFVKKYKTEPLVQYEVVMKEYVQVPDDLLKQTKELKKYFDQSYAHISLLKPKPTTKSKAGKGKEATGKAAIGKKK